MPVLFAGCAAVTPSYTPSSYYSLYTDSKLLRGETAIDAVLYVEPFESRERIQDRMLSRSGEYELEYAEFHRWIEPPAQMVRETIIDMLRGAEVYKSIVSTDRGIDPDAVLTGRLLVFETDGKNAYCSLELNLWDQKTGSRAIKAGTYSASAPLRQNTYTGAAEALSRCVETIVSDAVQEWRSL